MIHFEGEIQEELNCSLGTSNCDGINVEVTTEPYDYDVNNKVTYVAICDGCFGYQTDGI